MENNPVLRFKNREGGEFNVDDSIKLWKNGQKEVKCLQSSSGRTTTVGECEYMESMHGRVFPYEFKPSDDGEGVIFYVRDSSSEVRYNGTGIKNSSVRITERTEFRIGPKFPESESLGFEIIIPDNPSEEHSESKEIGESMGQDSGFKSMDEDISNDENQSIEETGWL